MAKNLAYFSIRTATIFHLSVILTIPRRVHIKTQHKVKLSPLDHFFSTSTRRPEMIEYATTPPCLHATDQQRHALSYLVFIIQIHIIH